MYLLSILVNNTIQLFHYNEYTKAINSLNIYRTIKGIKGTLAFNGQNIAVFDNTNTKAIAYVVWGLNNKEWSSLKRFKNLKNAQDYIIKHSNEYERMDIESL